MKLENMTPAELFDYFDKVAAERAERMPDEKAALEQMFDAYTRLIDLGWRESMYCPKDGTLFDAISAGSTGTCPTMYRGEWPNGKYWGFEAGDIWPSHPILFKLQEKDMKSTSDERVANNVMRHEYKVLSEEEKQDMQTVKDIGLTFHKTIGDLGDSRELSLAKTKIEEAVMWAVKHITG